MKRLIYFAAALLTLSLAACQEEEDLIEPGSGSGTSSIAVTGGTATFSFNTNTAWTASTDEDWLTVSPASGIAGDASITVTATANPTESLRTGSVTVTAGTASTSFTVTQNGKSTETYTFDVTATAKTFEYPLDEEGAEITVTEGADWFSYDSYADGNYKFNVADNTTDSDRTAVFTVSASASNHTVTVIQAAGYETLEAAEVTYYGTRLFIYDAETDSYPDYGAYGIKLSSSTTGTEVVLVLNTAKPEAPTEAVPSGTYLIDAAANHAQNTFSTNSEEEVYTVMTVDGTVYSVIDGEVTVSNADGTYTVSATLYDESETAHIFSYIGPINEIGEDSEGINYTSGTFKHTYDTHFTTKANTWDIYFVSNYFPDGSAGNLVTGFTIYSAAGEVSGEELPVGTFTFAEPETDASVTYSSGNLNAQPGTFTGSAYCYSSDYNYSYDYTGGTLTISKDETTGKYTVSFDLTYSGVRSYYDADWNYFEDDLGTGTYTGQGVVTVKDIVTGDYIPKPDVSYDFNCTALAYMVMYYGSVFSNVEADHAFYFSITPDGYNITLCINSTADYEFVENGPRAGYSVNPMPEGTYTFVTDGDNANFKGNNSILNASNRSYVLNGYTGTRLKVKGGSVTIANDKITLDLTCGVDGDDSSDLKFTGTVETSVNYVRDRR